MVSARKHKKTASKNAVRKNPGNILFYRIKTVRKKTAPITDKTVETVRYIQQQKPVSVSDENHQQKKPIKKRPETSFQTAL